MTVVAWSVAICLFWIVAALWLGGGPVRIEGGGGIRQSAALLLAFAVYLLAWRLLYGLLTGLIHPFAGMVTASLLSAALVPPLSFPCLRVFGVRIRKGTPSHGLH